MEDVSTELQASTTTTNEQADSASEYRGLSATYSPEDNKLRLYSMFRLDKELYLRVKSAGFGWAPKQEVFVAPMWTPEREDLLLQLCGEVGDEDTSLVDRAEQRAERFDDYSGKRSADASAARRAVSAIADNIPFGQPILIGHHSERHARKDAERIENGMRRAVKMWETSQYWKDRAAGALAHAKYKERPDVRARRIKGLESDRRKKVKAIEEAKQYFGLFATIAKKLEETGETPELRAVAERIAGNAGHIRGVVPLALNRNKHGYRDSFYDAFRWTENPVTVAQVCEWAAQSLERWTNPESHYHRWIAHFDNRLEYERAMLTESGYIEPPKPATRAVLPLLNYTGRVRYRSPYGREDGESEAHPMTKAAYAAINKDYKGTFTSADKTHRVRSALITINGARCLTAVFLTDSKEHPRPDAIAPGGETKEQEAVAQRIQKARETIDQKGQANAEARAHNREVIQRLKDHDKPSSSTPSAPTPSAEDGKDFDAMRQQLRNGTAVQVVSAPQLFPTPAALAARMVELAGLESGMSMIEPSAGTGNILRAVREASGGGVVRTAFEIDGRLCSSLRVREEGAEIFNRDFLSVQPTELRALVDAVVMNPPFENAADIAHIRHAVKFLKPGGRLVAICANGPRQGEALGQLVEEHGGTWEPLPEGTFAEQGTQVRTVLLTLTV